MTLHILKDSPFTSSQIKRCLSLAHQEDSFLLIENAVYAACASPNIFSSTKKCFVLSEDLQARGLIDKVFNDFTVINYHGFVELTETHKKIISW